MTTQKDVPSHTDLPPAFTLFQLATGHYVSHAIYVAATLGIADELAAGPRSCAELAKATATHAPSLKRVLRLLASVGILNETDAGDFALTPIGACLRRDVPGSFRSTALMFTGPLVRSAWGDLLHTVQTGEVAVEHVTGMNAFEYFAQHPEEAALFDEAMASFTSMVAMAVVAAYDFSSFGTLVDVGGGNGALLIGILNANPGLRGLVFDLPRVVAGATRQLAAAGLKGRCETKGGDFFEAVPSGADAYILKHVIHDWDDARALKILQNCQRAMRSQAKLLIVEGVYPPRIDQSLASRGAAANDVNMLVCTGGRQRSEAEFRELFAAAGFTFSRIVPTLAASSVIEATRA